jgi:hypothetical protein
MVNKYTCISSWTSSLLLASGYGQSRSPLRLAPTLHAHLLLPPDSLLSLCVGGTRELAPSSLHPHPPPALPRPHLRHPGCAPIIHPAPWNTCNMKHLDATYIGHRWNIWKYNCNICVKHMQHSDKILVTYVWKICNIHTKHLLQYISEIFFSKLLQHRTENTCKNMEHPDLLLQDPYVTIATYL